MDGCESWAIKKAERQIDAFELWCWRTLQSPLNYKEIQPVNPKGNQSWIFIGGTDTEAPILWPPEAKNWLMGKDPDAGKHWRREKKETTEDEMVGWHGLSKLRGLVMDMEAWHAAVHVVAKSRTRRSDWTELEKFPLYLHLEEETSLRMWV